MRVRVTGVLFRDDKVLILKENSSPDKHTFPGGGVEEGETLEEALKREFLEETNLDIQVGKPLYISEYTRKDNVNVLEVSFEVSAVNIEELNSGKHIFISIHDLQNEYPERKSLKVLANYPNIETTYLGRRVA